MFKSIFEKMLIVNLLFSLVGCQTIGKPIDRVGYTILDTLDGKDGKNKSDAKFCIYETVMSGVNGDRIWKGTANFEEINRRGVSCGVGQPEFRKSTDLYGDTRKLKLTNLSNKTICDVIKKFEQGSIPAVPTHMEEASRRGLSCVASVGVSNIQKLKADLPKMEPTGETWTSKVRSYIYE